MAQTGTTHLVDPQLQPLLAMLGGPIELSTALLPAMRERIGTTFASPAGDAPAPRVVDVPGSTIQVRVQVPAAAVGPHPAIYHMHGGGFVSGFAAMGDEPNGRRAQSHGAVVVSVDYRLAPETPFPGPVEDCYAGLAWLFANATDLNIDPDRVVITGESAGGGLAAALALLWRDRGGRTLAGQVLTYPMLDHRTGSPEDPYGNACAGEFVWTPSANRFGWAAMRGDQVIAADRLAHFSPALASDLAGLPPTFMGVGALDLFLNEDLAYAARLAGAGVPVEAHVYPGAFHAFDVMAGADVAQRYASDVNKAFARLLAP